MKPYRKTVTLARGSLRHYGSKILSRTMGAAMDDLLAFHHSCKKEYHAMLDQFNILFYGYGCKAALLSSLFPSARVFNLNLQKWHEVVSELVIQGFHTNPKASIADIDASLSGGDKLVLILVNFDFALSELQGLKNIRLVGTIENIDFPFDCEELALFNFILRDLTTFADYSDEILGVELASNELASALMVFESVPERSQKIFRELVEIGDCKLTELFNRVKIPLMIRKAALILDSLHEFMDHGIVKVKNENSITLKMSKEERKKMIVLLSRR